METFSSLVMSLVIFLLLTLSAFLQSAHTKLHFEEVSFTVQKSIGPLSSDKMHARVSFPAQPLVAISAIPEIETTAHFTDLVLYVHHCFRLNMCELAAQALVESFHLLELPWGIVIGMWEWQKSMRSDKVLGSCLGENFGQAGGAQVEDLVALSVVYPVELL